MELLEPGPEAISLSVSDNLASARACSPYVNESMIPRGPGCADVACLRRPKGPSVVTDPLKPAVSQKREAASRNTRVAGTGCSSSKLRMTR